MDPIQIWDRFHMFIENTRKFSKIEIFMNSVQVNLRFWQNLRFRLKHTNQPQISWRSLKWVHLYDSSIVKELHIASGILPDKFAYNC